MVIGILLLLYKRAGPERLIEITDLSLALTLFTVVVCHEATVIGAGIDKQLQDSTEMHAQRGTDERLGDSRWRPT
jgi:hypothetical protein